MTFFCSTCPRFQKERSLLWCQRVLGVLSEVSHQHVSKERQVFSCPIFFPLKQNGNCDLGDQLSRCFMMVCSNQGWLWETESRTENPCQASAWRVRSKPEKKMESSFLRFIFEHQREILNGGYFWSGIARIPFRNPSWTSGGPRNSTRQTRVVVHAGKVRTRFSGSSDKVQLFFFSDAGRVGADDQHILSRPTDPNLNVEWFYLIWVDVWMDGWASMMAFMPPSSRERSREDEKVEAWVGTNGTDRRRHWGSLLWDWEAGWL